jgi:hypothetical protein
LIPSSLALLLEDCNQSVIYTLDHDDTTQYSPLSVQVCSYNKLPVARRFYHHNKITNIAKRTCDIVCFVEVSKSRSKPRHMDVKTDPRHCSSSILHRHNTSTSPLQQQTPDHLPYTPPKTLTNTRQHADQVRNTTNTKHHRTHADRTADTTQQSPHPDRQRDRAGHRVRLQGTTGHITSEAG